MPEGVRKTCLGAASLDLVVKGVYCCVMEKLAQLEAVLEGLLNRVDSLEEENKRLQDDLKREEGERAEIQAKVEQLLSRVREKLG